MFSEEGHCDFCFDRGAKCERYVSMMTSKIRPCHVTLSAAPRLCGVRVYAAVASLSLRHYNSSLIYPSAHLPSPLRDIFVMTG